MPFPFPFFSSFFPLSLSSLSSPFSSQQFSEPGVRTSANGEMSLGNYNGFLDGLRYRLSGPNPTAEPPCPLQRTILVTVYGTGE